MMAQPLGTTSKITTIKDSCNRTCRLFYVRFSSSFHLPLFTLAVPFQTTVRPGEPCQLQAPTARAAATDKPLLTRSVQTRHLSFHDCIHVRHSRSAPAFPSHHSSVSKWRSQKNTPILVPIYDDGKGALAWKGNFGNRLHRVQRSQYGVLCGCAIIRTIIRS